MKFLISFIIIFLTMSIHACSQSMETVQKKLVHELTEKTVRNSWQLAESGNRIKITYIDTFHINTSISPLNNYNGYLNKADTLYIDIRLEENWTNQKYDSIRNAQQKILNPLIEKYIAHYDSIQWRYMKLNKEMFLYDYYRYLMHWDGFTKNERNQLEHLVRLPEKIINDIGLFTESSLQCYAMIQPESVNKKVSIAYQAFAETLGHKALYRCGDMYK